MAKFEGTIKEFHSFLGPRIRNRVNSLTKKDRRALNGICEHCGKKAHLDSAHVHEKGRKTIIDNILQKYIVDGHIKCDLKEFEQLLDKAHQPISDTFKFLCKECHREYDKHNKNHSKESTQDRIVESNSCGDLQIVTDVRLNEMPVGKIAENVLRPMLEKGLASEEEIQGMQTKDYSKATFHLNYPLLVKTSEQPDKARYYATPLLVKGVKYQLCNDWYEKNDKPALIKWIILHQDKEQGR